MVAENNSHEENSMSALTNISRLAHCCGFVLAFYATAAFAATTVEVSAEASRPAANDLVRTTVAAEANGASLGEVAREANRLIADALKIAKSYAAVKTRSGASNTYPIYASKGGKIEGWRMRSELVLESGDRDAISELLGRLQTTLAVSQLTLLPSPETRRLAEDAATTDAIGAFKARAQLVANALGKAYTIKEMRIGNADRPLPVAPMARMAEAAPMPLEAGESHVTVRVSGQIVLGD
jgi:predicted secreted protein